MLHNGHVASSRSNEFNSFWAFQRSPNRPGAVVRRAVLRVHGYNQWYYTLAPDCSYHDEAALDRLMENLPKPSPDDQKVRKNHLNRPAFNIQPDFVLSNIEPKPPIVLEKVNSTNLHTKILSYSYKLIASYCGEPKKFIYDFIDPLSYRIFGQCPNWTEEPVFVRIILCHRHGHNHGSQLSSIGILQASKLQSLVLKVVGRLSSISGVISSTSPECDQFSDRIWPTKSSIDLRRIRSSALTEKIFAYPYNYDETLLDIPIHAIESYIQKEAIAMEDARSIFSGALRGQGPLSCFPLTFDNIAEYKNQDEVMAINRFPMLPETKPKTLAGIYLDNIPAVAPKHKCPLSVITYTGHANILRFQIFEELGFPKHFWRFTHLPHASLIPVGLHYTGRPAIVIADAAYTLKNAQTLSFTPAYYGSSSETHKTKLLTDPVRVVLKHRS